ncbi:MAG: response regulator [Rhodospirillales bacterium]|nr:response regulator [Rhodospirillales bacterium]
MAKILLIDDDASTRKLIDEFMRYHDHEVIFAQDGAFGVSMTELEYPDIILLDIMMPVMSGTEALGILKRKPGLANIPVVVVSANDSPKLKRQMLDAGVVAFFDKPFDLTELLACIEGTLTFRPKSTPRSGTRAH